MSAPPRPGALAVRVVSRGGRPAATLVDCLERDGIDYVASDPEAGVPAGAADCVLLDALEAGIAADDAPFVGASRSRVPVLAVLAPSQLGAAPRAQADDVIVCPWHPGELALRVERLKAAAVPDEAPGISRVDDLVIDTNRYDVFLAGRPVLLTFKEYELLKVLAANPGRVYRRETLLEQVWGYAYFGGTRTVDVHVRRLRSKIEDATHTFIDTVWNVGYRFRG